MRDREKWRKIQQTWILYAIQNLQDDTSKERGTKFNRNMNSFSVFHSQPAEERKLSWFGDNAFDSRIKCIFSCVLAHADVVMMLFGIRGFVCGCCGVLGVILLVFGGCSLWWCSACCGGAEELSGRPGGSAVAHITASLWARGSARPEETDTCAAGTDTPTDTDTRHRC